MIFFIFICSLVLVIGLEILSMRDSLRPLRIAFLADMDLVEPGEIITLKYTIRNESFLPVLYVSLGLHFDDCYTICEDEEWIKKHVTSNSFGTIVDHRLYLFPHTKFSGKIRIALNKRGYHDLGRCYVEKSDLLGLFPIVSSFAIGEHVICTAKKADTKMPDSFGGLMGQTSVRRFIHDDPTLLIGYRDYTGREPMKQISWVQTAKNDRMTVKVYDHTADQNITLVVNLQAEKPDAFEQCLSVTRSVCEELEKRKIPYGIYSNGELFELREGLGHAHLRPLLKRIGIAGSTCYISFESLVERVLENRVGSDSYIVITPSVGEGEKPALKRLQSFSDTRLFILSGEVSKV